VTRLYVYSVTVIWNFDDWILCFVDRSYGYNHVKKNQLDAQLILSIFRQPLHVSVVSMPIIRRSMPIIRRYNRMYTTIGTYYSF